jgi:UDP-2,4-diacetamido-2,4,6-trideoxy-beta-L-altropyranose hydrolase
MGFPNFKHYNYLIMKILIRVDSSFLMGTGHVARCVSLAELLRSRGEAVTFVCRILDGNITSLIEEKQFKVIKLDSPSSIVQGDQFDKMRGVQISTEIQEMRFVLDAIGPDWVIVDHYGLSIEWEDSIRSRGIKLLSIDDLLRKHNCNALLDQNFHFDLTAYHYLVPSNSFLFVGQEYALLNSSFFSLTPHKRDFNNIREVLIFFGGTDPYGETLKCIQALEGLNQFHFHVVVGGRNPFLIEIKKICSRLTNFTLHIQIDHMSKLMNQSDLYIGSGGTITWERCYMGLPAICISVAENQNRIAEILEANFVHKYIGESKNLTMKDYRNSLLNLVKDPARLALYSSNSLNLKVGTKISEVLDLFR